MGCPLFLYLYFVPVKPYNRCIMWTYLQLLGLFLLILFIAYIAVIYYGKKQPDNKDKMMNAFLWGALIFYFCFLFSLTFGVGRRTPEFILFDAEKIQARLKFGCNLMPFKTIKSLFRYNYSLDYILVNLVGNIAALMPLGVLFPMRFSSAKKCFNFTLMVVGVVVFIEVVQFVFNVGALDIDDLILNVLGAELIFVIYKIFTKKA